MSMYNIITNLDANSIRALVQNSITWSLPEFIQKLLSKAGNGFKGRESFVGLFLIIFGTQAYYWRKYSYWSSRGVKTPRPLPFFGNFLSFVTKPRQVLQLEWAKNYGKIHGYYIGTKPYLVCADANILKQICIKDFDKFPNHFFVAVKNKYQKHFLIMQQDNHWRNMRAILTPTFTSGKIMKMYPLLNNCAEDLINLQKRRLEQSEKVEINIRKLFGAFSMGSALNSFYGINMEYSQSESDDVKVYTKDKFAEKSQIAFSVTTLRFILNSLLPISLLKFLNFPLAREAPMKFFYANAEKIIENRKKNPISGHTDYLQLLLEAKADSSIEKAEGDEAEEHHALMNNSDASGDADTSGFRPSRYKLTEMEVTCQTMMLMLVATETTATLLTHTIYLLAQHPDVQEKLYQELTKIMIPKVDPKQLSSFDYSQLTSCHYLDNVISESLRLMGPALAMDREASEDYYVKNYDIWIPKGTTVVLDYYAIQHDPDYWPEPEKFDPDRFSPENKANIVPGSYCPFGIGPRSCIGFRFALTEAKVGLSKFISEFRVERAPETVYPPEPERITFILNSNQNLRVMISKRN